MRERKEVGSYKYYSFTLSSVLFLPSSCVWYSGHIRSTVYSTQRTVVEGGERERSVLQLFLLHFISLVMRRSKGRANRPVILETIYALVDSWISSLLLVPRLLFKERR